MLVEDEKAVLNMVRKTLSRCGYRVLTASNGEEAIRVCRQQHPEVIDILVTDVVMPGELNGAELAEHVMSSHPEIKVLYMSGHTNDAIAHYGVLDQGVAFLQKPFALDMVARKVREVLDESPGKRRPGKGA
ncbi:MAG: response regulator [Desulfobacterales bacterium]|nr:response regulator [Desulfobacterales bacterium]